MPRASAERIDPVDELADQAELRPRVREGDAGEIEVEEDYLDLPRIAFTHTRSKFGLIRKLIDRINSFG